MHTMISGNVFCNLFLIGRYIDCLIHYLFNFVNLLTEFHYVLIQIFFAVILSQPSMMI